ncbi:MAG: hypothetical protein WKG07_18825 [Hymenobacter sp.]
MATIHFGGVPETVITRDEFPLTKALDFLQHDTIAVIGYGVQGPGQALNMRDNGFHVIVGQREGTPSWDRAITRWLGAGRVAVQRSRKRPTRVPSSAICSPTRGRLPCGRRFRKALTPGKTLYFSHGFGITFKDQTNIIPPADVDVILVAPKGSGTSLRRLVCGRRRAELVVCGVPGCQRARLRKSRGDGYWRGLGLLVRDRF